MPINKGRIVHEQTARIDPDTEATEYERNLFALAPKYLITEAWLTNTTIAPAMKKAGMRQSRTCSCAYHFVNARDSFIALVNRAFSIGRK
jgi:hypothetical protein